MDEDLLDLRLESLVTVLSVGADRRVVPRAVLTRDGLAAARARLSDEDFTEFVRLLREAIRARELAQTTIFNLLQSQIDASAA